MEVISACPLPAASLLWQPRPGATCLTVLCKATFSLNPPVARLAAEQEPIRDADVYHEEARGSLWCASDLVPAKPRADVVLVGHARAPGGEPVRSLLVRLAVGEWSKSIEVVRDRALLRDGRLWEGLPFTSMPLVYERAAGGTESWNPVGKARDAWSAKGALALPNLQRPGTRVEAPGDAIEPVGFGPIAPGWPGRRRLLGRHAAPPADPRALRDQAIPRDFDLSYFNVAPADQQVSEIRGDAVLVLEHLHPERASVTLALPGISPRATAVGPRREEAVVPLRCDTLWIDADRALCTLTWRGQVLLAEAEEPGRITITLDAPVELEGEAETNRTPEVVADGAKADAAQTMAGGLVASRPAMPFISGIAPGGGPRQHAPWFDLPFQPAGAPAPERPAALSQPAAAADQRPPALVGSAGSMPPPTEPVPLATPAQATAEPAPQAREALEAGEVLQLIWYAPESMPRIRRRKRWREILDDIDEQPIDPELEDPELSTTPAEVEDRRSLAAILRRGEPLAPEALERALDEGVHDGGFTPKIALVAGELWLPFSEIGLLEALIATVTPLSAEDEKLRAAVRAASDFAALPCAATAPAVAEGLGARIKELLRQGRRAVPIAAIEAQAERGALEQRAYQRRTVLGGPHLRALLQSAGGQGGVPVYLPERLSPELPMFQRLKVRLLAEVHPPVDQQEPAPVALRAAALGRIIAITKR